MLALFEACKKGNYAEMENCLSKLEDFTQKDAAGLTPLEYAKMKNHLNYHPYRKKLQAKLKPDYFDEDVFRQLAEVDPKWAKIYLNQFSPDNGYKYEFKQLDAIFGLSDVKTRALASILNDSIVPSQMDEKLDLLQHPVLKRVLDIKWDICSSKILSTCSHLYDNAYGYDKC
ncbi:hypothetical protein THRCLA_22680 [Thraustotheca clavata]|uniref:Uncharacterized protein n=1 Tax=Thraustotheca clavata TaxID=74557 RepID=A0A1V9YUI9_9STRA|nr:hypothetical protein THRCLA_22680 [Thraustotheca clavata]